MYELTKDQIELLKTPTLTGAMKYWRWDLLGPPASADAPLAGLHKARLRWKGSTQEMKDESTKWLIEHGYMPK